MPGPYSPAQKKIVVMAEPRDKIDGKDFAMLRSKGKKREKKHDGTVQLIVEVVVWE